MESVPRGMFGRKLRINRIKRIERKLAEKRKLLEISSSIKLFISKNTNIANVSNQTLFNMTSLEKYV